MNEILNYIQRIYQTFTPTDALEVALIAAVIYMIYRGLRGTRGARVVRGFIFLLLVSFVVMRILSDYLQMGRLRTLYGLLVPAMAVLAAIVFQPELRRSLMRLGENPILRLFLKEGASAFVDRIVRSAAMLSRNKIGAIIAVERDTRLGAVIESGTYLDAELTSRLLTTIFWPGSPLHDMGVVIRGGRIAAAGCQFPLPRQSILEAKHGTRHRAAVGLSEETDAVIVVVSEETGNISLAVEGRLETPFTPEELRSRLTDLLRSAEATLTEHSLAESDTPKPRVPEPESEAKPPADTP
ncbi:MAG: diadenylate cyclase CdaA [Planctomycetota bacterium]|nr:diadenylate cyclase CdaA [Planctomycetota bacterium]